MAMSKATSDESKALLQSNMMEEESEIRVFKKDEAQKELLGNKHFWGDGLFVRCALFSEHYFQLICTNQPKTIKMSEHDDEIYQSFKENFPNFPLRSFTREFLLSAHAKKMWKMFIKLFEDKVCDPYLGCSIRLNCRETYTCDNIFLGVRMQHIAIELARNRSGLNDHFYNKYKDTFPVFT